ncbi:MAG TPA: 1-deoxy-D-xylulose-5-phosphate synthase [Spirochaetota bacterium]|nr:1-deoxy-D-xylulose-5-phosphate synthase [Spirochaetota bacterium]
MLVNNWLWFATVLLDSIRTVADLRKLEQAELDQLNDEIRNYIIDVVSERGGHLASSLGVVELTSALHYVFNTPRDKIIWDVGHQSYAHKIITGRKEEFKTLRKFHGLSGFPKRSESVYDAFNTGHSSTSLSLALGEAVGRDLKNEKYKVIAVIGDGSLTGGMAFEALNQIGHLKNDLIIILNDNEHSISKNVGALSEYLMRLITGTLYNRLRKGSFEIIKKIPRYGNSLYDFINRAQTGVKGILVPGHFFEELGIRYFGPVDGHNTPLLIDILSRIRDINSGPKLLHVITKKGKGYGPAEKNPSRFHGIGPFNRKTGRTAGSSRLSYSEITGRTLADISKKDKKVIAITAAMKLGTGLYEFEKKAPRRFFDVGIAEQHAVTFAAAVASKGFKPFVSIYSTFLQRAVDQIIHDVAIMKLPVRLLIDRAGIVGDDGETHHGLFDVSIIRNIPNFMFLAPSNGEELRDMLYFAAGYNEGPIAIRYSRGSIGEGDMDISRPELFVPGRVQKIRNGRDVAIFALGDMVDSAINLHRLLGEEGIKASVVNILSIKPLDVSGIQKIIRNVPGFITMENGVLSGGIGEYILSAIDKESRSRFLFSAGFPDVFITHGKPEELFRKYSLDPESLRDRILQELVRKTPYDKRDKVRHISFRK